MKQFLLIAALLAASLSAWAQTPGRESYDSALARVEIAHSPARITGVVVPHHLPALDLAVRVFALTAGRQVERIILLCPDHYRQSRTPFATTRRDFLTPYGPVRVDGPGVDALTQSPLVSESSLFDNEHGANVLMPLVAVFHPGTPVIPVAARITASRNDCERLAELLSGLVTQNTLVVLSADFSHHQSPDVALKMDQRSLSALAQNAPAAVAALRQPENVDTVAMLTVQALLQKRLGSSFTALDNRDTSEVAGTRVPDATSYITGVWGKQSLPVVEGKRLIFAGDVFLGRGLRAAVEDPTTRALLVGNVLRLTGGADLVVNLEGVLSESCPPEERGRTLCMPSGPALEVLKSMHVMAVSLANNHSHDLGDDAYRHTVKLLTDVGLVVLEKNTLMDLGLIRVAAFTDLENGKSRAETALDSQELAVLEGESPVKPLAVFVHWGQEWIARPDSRQLYLYDRFREKGAGLVIGAHPHTPGPLECGDGGCMAASLGNLLFDQTRPDAGGSLLEVTVFPRGTWFVRLIPAGNPAGEFIGKTSTAGSPRKPDAP